MPATAAIIWMLLGGAAPAQVTWHVQGNGLFTGSGTAGNPFGSIQQGINAAAAGDVVLVQPGTYFESVNFQTKAITVRSTQGPAGTTISGILGGTMVLMLQGPGGGSAALEGFTVSGGTDGGIRCSGDATIRDCRVQGNQSFGGFAAGISCVGGSPVIEGCVVSANTGTSYGGIRAQFGGPLIKDTLVTGNTSAVAGIVVDQSQGGAVRILNCLVQGNSSPGVSCLGGSVCFMVGCTVVDNAAGSQAGLQVTASYVEFHNGILRGNATAQIGTSGPATVIVGHSNVEGGWPGLNNIDADPQFANPAAGDYHLTAGSPCVEAGDNAAPFLPLLDFEGDPRLVGSTVDMGMDELFSSAVAPPFPGSGEDLVLLTLVNGGGIPSAPLKSANPGDLLTVQVLSPGGTFLGAPPLLFGQPYPTGGAGPLGIPGLPVHVDPGLAFVLYDGLGSPLGPLPLQPQGISLVFQLPPALSGQTIRLQGAVLSAAAANGLFASTDAHEIQVL